jgi:hypothetical protein
VLHEWASRLKLLSAGRYANGAIVALIILASVGTGFLASRLWPLPTSLTPTLKITSADATSPGRQIDIRPASRALADGTVPSTKSEPVDVTENPAGVPFVLLNKGATEQPRPFEEGVQLSTAKSPDVPDVSADQRKPPTRPAGRSRVEKAPSPQLARGQRKHQAQANLAQPSPGPTGYQRDAAMRDFMSHGPPFRY